MTQERWVNACFEVYAVSDSLDQCGVCKMFKERLDSGCVLKTSKLVGDRLGVEMGGK